VWQSTGNLIGNNDTGRYDTSQIQPGTQVSIYDDALALLNTFPDHEILGIQLVVDGGWNGGASGGNDEQIVFVDNVTVNNHKTMGRNAN
jgi:hypothetical protein